MNDKLIVNFIEKFPIEKGKKDEPYVIIIDGYTGMGKSTVARCISKFDNSVILNNDEVRCFLNDYGDKSNLKDYLQKYRLEKMLENNNSCIIDSCFCHNYKEKLDYYNSLGVKYYVIKLECSSEVVKERLEKRKLDKNNFSIANYDDYLWMMNNVERVPMDLVDFVIDTEVDIDEQVINFLMKYNLIDGNELRK